MKRCIYPSNIRYSQTPFKFKIIFLNFQSKICTVKISLYICPIQNRKMILNNSIMCAMMCNFYAEVAIV
ncbi:MAG: hypothetical protein COS42_01855 [Flavobacteriales bacterium CG03_land_8_20_14_0_80_35_15]|nr:MAG: hypothetical protein AUJ53_02980 [Flavobacteriaceae bacterium CG1_02_35_72]PIR12552.1 MAG: hypothetical protein COV50_08390 [Flavobacteriales bacterium CG11_big_fil_rev_8_21_14_0_20_35_7]PIV18522.1 MAG: hypothetical protein COS42_01855 [Flavobacteriales bacterium CG03_land_8_20_14_0_80_35_15]PIX06485.1 MAG: hypothetical protein COZ76_08610 [Flavobacteriales bacterium CG_4_8_14_3_um_filter_35_10]